MLTEITIQKKEYLTKMALASLKRTAYEYVNLSQICHEYHQEFGYQDYSAWVKNDLGLGSRRGDQLLNVYDRFGVTAVTAVENLPAEIMFLLAAPSVPESARTEAIEKAENGESLTIKQTKELVEAHKRIDVLRKELDLAKAQIPTDDIKAMIAALEARLEYEINKPPVVETVIVEKVPDDYRSLISERDTLVDEKGRLLRSIKRLKDSQGEEVEKQVNQKLKALEEDFNLKNGQLKAIQDRIDYLRESMKQMDKTAGDLAACKKACDQIRGFLLDISVALRDLFEDHKLTKPAEKEMRHLCSELEQGAAAFRKYLDGEKLIEIGG